MDEVSAAPAPKMDQDFVAQNKIAAKYVAGLLTTREATEFERFCRDNPKLIDATGLPERVNAGVRLLDVAGSKQPWDPEPLQVWQRLPVVLALAALVVALAFAARAFYATARTANARVATLQRYLDDAGSAAISGTETIRLEPSRTGPVSAAQFQVDLSRGPRWLDLHFNLSWQRARVYRISIERAEQGREFVLGNLLKDSNGEVRIGLNSSLLGNGPHNILIDAQGLGAADLTPVAWSRFDVERPKR